MQTLGRMIGRLVQVTRLGLGTSGQTALMKGVVMVGVNTCYTAKPSKDRLLGLAISYYDVLVMVGVCGAVGALCMKNNSARPVSNTHCSSSSPCVVIARK